MKITVHKVIVLFTFILFNKSVFAQCWDTIAAGGNHCIGIKTDGTLWAWGYNYYGQLGDGTSTDRHIPTQIGTATNWKQVDAGGDHCIGIKTDGTLWAWGYNDRGQLGDGTTTDKHYLTQIGVATNWKQVFCGLYHTLAIKTDGTLWAWGWNGNAQLGDGTTTDRHIPTQIGTATNWTSISGGTYHSMGIKTDGTLWGWGHNGFYQLGVNTITPMHTPTQIGTATDWKQVEAGDQYSIGLKTDSTLWAWGGNSYGQLGDGSTTEKRIPTQIGTATNWKSISGGLYHSMAIKTDGTLWAWGWNVNGQLGDGTYINKLIPTQLGSSTNWKYIFAGEYLYSAALKADGSRWAWGVNDSGQFGDGTTVNRTSPILIDGTCVVPCLPSIMVTNSTSTTICEGTAVAFTASVTNGGTTPLYQWQKNGINLGTGLTTYSLTTLVNGDLVNCILTSNSACASTSTVISNSISFTVNPLPIISVNSGSICSGKIFTINPTGANTYTVTGGLFNVSPTATTSYSVIGTSTQGCLSSNVAVSSVTVNALPTISVNSGAICSGNSFSINPTGANTFTVTGGQFNVSPTTTISYSVIGTSIQGCLSSNIAVSSVTVNSLPTITVNSGAICSGKTFTINPNGAGTYTVTGDQFNVSPTATTSYSIAGTSAQGCLSSNTAVSSVTVNSLPTVSIISTNTLLCTGQTANLTAQGATSYSWSTGSMNSVLAVNPTIATTYTVLGTNNNNCSNSASYTQQVSLCTSVNELGVYDSNIKLYPNPNNGEFTIEISNETDVVIFNLLGELIYSTILPEGQHVLNITNKPNGMYLVKLGINSQQSFKFIKN